MWRTPKKPGPKGPHASTLSKEKAREALRVVILKEMHAMVAGQIAQAKGLKYLVARDPKTGKFERVTAAKARQGLGEKELIEVWEKDPSTQAFNTLMDRALDKPKEQEQEIKLTGEVELVNSRLLLARKRLSERKP